VDIATASSADAGVVDGAPAADAAPPVITAVGAAAACPPGQSYGPPLPANPALTPVKEGFTVLEGPVWIAGLKTLFFSEFEELKGRIHKYTPADGKFAVLVDNVGVNGLTVDPEGQIVAASQDMQRLTRFDPLTGKRSPIAGTEGYGGKPFNATNDVIVRTDGVLYFTDPTFLNNNRPGQGVGGFYRVSPAGMLTRLGTGQQPNALGLSLDGRWLYVTSSGGDPVRRFPLGPDGTVTGPGTPYIDTRSESWALDCGGNVYLSSDGRVKVYSAAGQPLGTFGSVPAGITNLTFGDEDGRTLYATARGGLYKLRVNVPGLGN
jgi:gluconolactonase